MWLQATLTAKDLHDALDKVTPLRVPLDADVPISVARRTP